jgi:hypothetical protein
MTAADATREGRASNIGSVISVFIGSLERLPPSHLFGVSVFRCPRLVSVDATQV